MKTFKRIAAGLAIFLVICGSLYTLSIFKPEEKKIITIHGMAGSMRCESQAILENGDTIPHGSAKLWHSNGTLRQINHACIGTPCDTSKWWDSLGRLEGMSIFKDGKEIETHNLEYTNQSSFYTLRIRVEKQQAIRSTILEDGTIGSIDTVNILENNTSTSQVILNCHQLN